MLRYLVGILEKEEKRELVKLSVLMLISPIFDLFSFSVILYILNTAIQQNRASLELIFFSGCMGGASLIKGFFELYKCYIQNRFINFSAQRISVKIFELFEKEDLQEHNKKSPMQALAIVREDTANCMSVLSGSVSLLISGFTLAILRLPDLDFQSAGNRRLSGNDRFYGDDVSAEQAQNDALRRRTQAVHNKEQRADHHGIRYV